MWMSILMSVLSSELTKKLIAFGINKLLASKSDGITKDLAVVMLDGIAMSKSNNANEKLVSIVKEVL